ncbi:hypothetical protein [Halarchaeum salinum]|uniref:Lipoprotein n=1 Tax=Halarchaeum salinum TaxID=489912 RepID=A0AAV3S3K0_9EURY
MVPKRPLLLPTCLVLLVSAGCLGGGGPPPSDPAAERVVSDAVNASADVTEYRATGGGTATARRGGDERSVSFEREAAVNRTTRRGRVTVSSRDEERTAYLVDDAYYVPCYASRYVNVPDAWYAASEVANWRTNDSLGVFVNVSAGAPVQSAGPARIDGVNATVIDAYPTAAALADSKRRFESVSDRDVGAIEDARIRLWVANDTRRILRVRSVVNSSTNGVSITQRTTLDYAYGANVSVTAPAHLVDSEDACPTIEDADLNESHADRTANGTEMGATSGTTVEAANRIKTERPSAAGA